MNFAFTEEQEELRSSARAFLVDHSSGEQVSIVLIYYDFIGDPPT